MVISLGGGRDFDIYVNTSPNQRYMLMFFDHFMNSIALSYQHVKGNCLKEEFCGNARYSARV